MKFELNEAPQVALDTLNDEGAMRGLGYCFTIFFCPFTLGANLLCGDDDDKTAGSTCCWPKGLTSEEKEAISKLRTGLEKLIKNVSITKESGLNEWITGQLVETRTLLKEAAGDTSIVLYSDAIKNALDDLDEIEQAGETETDPLQDDFQRTYSGSSGRVM